MRVTRRQFLASAAAVVPLRWPLDRVSLADEPTVQWAILDLGPHCSLDESLSGYAAALGPGAPRSDRASVARGGTLIVPAAVRIPPAAVDAIATCLGDGGRVILESGAGFANEADFAAHRAVLREAFDVHVDRPVDLWPGSHGRAIPYVDFLWPFPAWIRDFSRVVPLQRRAGEIIARVTGLPVALRQAHGRGTLIVLGTPVGPVLWTGDVDARRWLFATVRTALAMGRPRHMHCYRATPNVNTVREW